MLFCTTKESGRWPAAVRSTETTVGRIDNHPFVGKKQRPQTFLSDKRLLVTVYSMVSLHFRLYFFLGGARKLQSSLNSMKNFLLRRSSKSPVNRYRLKCDHPMSPRLLSLPFIMTCIGNCGALRTTRPGWLNPGGTCDSPHYNHILVKFNILLPVFHFLGGLPLMICFFFFFFFR